MKRKAIAGLVFGMLAHSFASADDLKLRNVQLVDAGHITSIVGTVANTSDHLVQGGYLNFEVTRKGEVVARETVQVPDLEAGQAWRIWQPVQHSGTKLTMAVHARDPQVAVTADVVPYPDSLVAH